MTCQPRELRGSRAGLIVFLSRICPLRPCTLISPPPLRDEIAFVSS